METKDFSALIHISKILEGLTIPWFVAGGYAIDLFLGRISREHKDVDLCIFRDTLPQVLEFFSNWERHIIEPSTKSPVFINNSSFQPSPLQHELHFKKGATEIEFLLISRHQGQVVYRRDDRIRIAVEDFSMKSFVPFVAPEWQLLFKAKEAGEKDNLDFDNCLPYLNHNRAVWLLHALEITLPDNEWINQLRTKIDQ
jgi:Aminoglycoside-2''-adenylyltransferase